MRTLLTIALSATVLATASAQIVLGEDWLLSAGFEMALGVDEDFDDPNGLLARTGANQVWDFGALGTNADILLEARDASEGASRDSFPTADLVFTARGDRGVGIAQPGTEAYLRKDGDDLLILGYAETSDVSLLPVVRLSDPLTFQSTPIAFGNSGGDQTRLQLTFDASFIADIASDEPGADLIDSIRLTIGQEVSYDVEGYGTLAFNGEQYDALRIRSTTEVFQEVEARLPFLGWQPITDLIPDSLLNVGLGAARTQDVSFVVAEYSWPVVQISLDSTGAAQEIAFRSDGTVGTRDRATAAAQLGAYAYDGELVVEVNAAQPLAGAQLHVLGADGRELLRRPVDGLNTRARIDASAWTPGVVVVALLDSRGALVGTQKVLLAD